MKITWLEHYKKCCKKYGVIKWHILLLLVPVFILLLGAAQLFKTVGSLGEWIESTINRI